MDDSRREIANHSKRAAAFWVTAILAATSGYAQQPDAPELTVDQAIEHALQGNYSLKKAELETRKAARDLAADRTKRFASLQLISFGSQLLTKPSVTFQQGSLGNYPTIGPIPAADQKIEVARKPVGVVVASASQPLTKLIRLNLELAGQALGVEADRQEEQKTRLDVVDKVRRAYYEVAETQSQLDSLLASLPYYQESKRLATERRKRETILESELLNADAQLLEQQDEIAESKNLLSTDSEKLNDLMGRDIHIQFRVSSLQAIGSDLESSDVLEARAIENRPDLKKAKLQVRQAVYESRAKKAEYIPEVSLSANYLTTVNFGNTLPGNITAIGLQLTWEPWDWGKKRQELASKRLQEVEAKIAVDSATRTVLLDVRKAARQIENSRRQVIQTEASQRASRAKLRETQEKFARETVLAKDLFSAQSDLASADYDHQQALSSFWKARADLKKATGEQ